MTLATIIIYSFSDFRIFRLFRVLSKLKSSLVDKHLPVTTMAAKTRYWAGGAGSQEKKYVNVAAGDSTMKELDEIVARLTQAGFGAQKVPGPLLLSTTGGKSEEADAKDHCPTCTARQPLLPRLRSFFSWPPRRQR